MSETIFDIETDYSNTKVKLKGEVMKRFVCIVCGFVYDEAEGMPEEGIAAGTRWEDIPNDWECPECGVSKSDFEMKEMVA
jgi:rubredoxin